MLSWLQNPAVAIESVGPRYPEKAPFHPGTTYPEAPFPEVGNEPNPVYEGVRQSFRRLGLDAENFAKPGWNPLKEIVTPGDTVLLKPNLIRESHAQRTEEWVQVITHGAVVRVVVDYVCIALQGNGRVVIADGPQTDSDYDEICNRNGLFQISEYLHTKGINVQLLDLRRDRWFQKGDIIYKRVPLPGDPSGYTTIELGGISEFNTYTLSGNFYGADCDIPETSRFHNRERHGYVLCRTVLDANVVINLPKLKTHKKAGVTLSLKNMVGINGYRNCLPHHTIGTPDHDGDEFPISDLNHKFQSGATVAFKKVLAWSGTAGAWARATKRGGIMAFGSNSEVVRSGNWYGNDTIWRTVLDLNRCLFYFDGEGKSRTAPLKYMTIVDGVIGGDGNGPMSPDPLNSGILVAGFNPVAVDSVCAVLMGFDYRKIPSLANAWRESEHPLVSLRPEHVSCRSAIIEWNGSLNELERAPHLHFNPHFGWAGHIECAALNVCANPADPTMQSWRR